MNAIRPSLERCLALLLAAVLVGCGDSGTNTNTGNDAGQNSNGFCGDGVKDGDEACDDGELNSDSEPDACRSNCRLADCGDAVVDTGEECDDGNSSNTDDCLNTCVANVCGDGYVNETAVGSSWQVEACDNGTNDGTLCRADCQQDMTLCGNQVVDQGEECDLGGANSDNPDADCRSKCTLAGCGDGILDSDEECDDGTGINSDTEVDACRTNCLDAHCGDGVLDTGEDCDDGNNAAGDSCPSNCVFVDCDLDGDGYQRSDSSSGCPTSDYPSGRPVDCDDTNAAVYPGITDNCSDNEGDPACAALALCDGLDNDCDGQVDEGCPAPSCDADGDGFQPSGGGCTPPTGQEDCDDNDPLIHPGAPDRCGDGVAQDCVADTACVTDADGDHYDASVDCDDNNPDVNPGAVEVCNGVDDDCDGLVDEGNPDDQGNPMTDHYCNDDADGVCGDSSGAGVCVCSQIVPGTARDGSNRVICPGEDFTASNSPRCFFAPQPSTERCDALDHDCDGANDDPSGTNLVERGQPCGATGTGACVIGTVVGCDYSQTTSWAVNEHFVCSGDAVGPVAETCNGVDDDCDGAIDCGNGLCGVDQPCYDAAASCTNAYCANPGSGYACDYQPYPDPSLVQCDPDDGGPLVTADGRCRSDQTCGMRKCLVCETDDDCGEGLHCLCAADDCSGSPFPGRCYDLDPSQLAECQKISDLDVSCSVVGKSSTVACEESTTTTACKKSCNGTGSCVWNNTETCPGADGCTGACQYGSCDWTLSNGNTCSGTTGNCNERVCGGGSCQPAFVNVGDICAGSGVCAVTCTAAGLCPSTSTTNGVVCGPGNLFCEGTCASGACSTQGDSCGYGPDCDGTCLATGACSTAKDACGNAELCLGQCSNSGVCSSYRTLSQVDGTNACGMGHCGFSNTFPPQDGHYYGACGPGGGCHRVKYNATGDDTIDCYECEYFLLSYHLGDILTTTYGTCCIPGGDYDANIMRACRDAHCGGGCAGEQ